MLVFNCECHCVKDIICNIFAVKCLKMTRDLSYFVELYSLSQRFPTLYKHREIHNSIQGNDPIEPLNVRQLAIMMN